MSYIEKIRNNIAEAIAIKKKAKEMNIDYVTAKIMYHNGAKDIDLETAKKIKIVLDEAHVPARMIDIFDLIDESNSRNKSAGNEPGAHAINIKMPNKPALKYSEELANYKIKRKYIEELSKFFWADYYYKKEILKIMTSGFPLEVAIQLFEIKLKYEMKKNDLSETAALAKILYFHSTEAAKVFEKAYLNNRATIGKPIETVKNEIMFEVEYKKKYINGITLVSKTEEGLKKLEYVVTEVFKEANKELTDILPVAAAKNKLMLTDISLTKENSRSHYDQAYNYICLNTNNYTLDSSVMVFYHEVTHFLDNIKGKGKYTQYSEENPVVNSLLNKIAEKISPIQRGLSLNYLTNMNAKRYANNPALNQKWMQEIRETFPNLSKDDYKILMQQKRMEKRKKYKLTLHFLTDIYDGLTGGKLYTYFAVPGHGEKYYQSKNSILKEFIANIGLIVAANETDILRFEFGDELADQLIDMYRELINKNESKGNTR